MRKIAVVAVLVVLLVSSRMAFALQNEPEGFRDLKWEDPPTETMKFIDDTDEFMQVYSDPSADNSIGSVNFYKILYAFYVDTDESLKFTGVVLLYNTEKYFETLQTLCLNRFGPATDEDYQELSWEGGVGLVHLKYDSIGEKGWLSMDSAQLWNQYMERKKQRQVEEAEGDW